MRHGEIVIPLILPLLTSPRAVPLMLGCILLILALCQIIQLRESSSISRGHGLVRLVVQDQALYYFMYVITIALFTVATDHRPWSRIT